MYVVTTPIDSVIAWIAMGIIVGFVIGIRVATHIHYRKLRGALCQKCIRGFWQRYEDSE